MIARDEVYRADVVLAVDANAVLKLPHVPDDKVLIHSADGDIWIRMLARQRPTRLYLRGTHQRVAS